MTNKIDEIALKGQVTTLEKLQGIALINSLKEQVAQLELEVERMKQAVRDRNYFANKLTSLQSKSAALADTLEKSRIGLVQWHVPENRYSAINAIDDALAAFKGEK